MPKFYKEDDSSWNICDMIYPAATCKLSWIDDDDMIITSIYNKKDVIYNGVVTNLFRKDGTPYINKQDFIDTVVEFFIRPTSKKK